MNRNIVLIVLDTVRKDYFEKHAPRIRERSDASFERCYAASSWTVPSHASMLTGKLPHQHGVHAHNIDLGDLNPDEVFLNDLNDHRILGVSANANANVERGFDSHFDEFIAESFNRFGLLRGGIDIDSFAAQYEGDHKLISFLLTAIKKGELLPSLVNGTLAKLYDKNGWTPNVPRYEDYGAKAVIENVENINTTEPFFLYANLMEAHMPHRAVKGYSPDLYSVPASWSSYEVDNWDINNGDPGAYDEYLHNIRELYRASIDYLDRKVVQLIDRLEKDTDRETTYIVTSDHGEMLGLNDEIYALGHNSGGVSEELLHVPCHVINPPGDLNTEGIFTQLDMGPLCTGLAAGRTPSVGRDRAPAERIGLAGRGNLKEIEEFDHWDRAQRCLYDGATKIIWDSEGKITEYEVGNEPSRQALIGPAEIPENVDDHFQSGLKEYKLNAIENEGEGLDDVGESVKQHLIDLGYG